MSVYVILQWTAAQQGSLAAYSQGMVQTEDGSVTKCCHALMGCRNSSWECN